MFYSEFNIERVSATRMINSRSAGRGKINELIISNIDRREKMANRVFETWLSGFRDSIADYGYYIDFEKVKKHSPRIYSPVQQVDEGERRIVFGELKNDRISLEQICRKHYLNRLPLIKRIYYKIKAIKYTLFPL